MMGLENYTTDELIPSMLTLAVDEAGWKTHSVVQKTRLLWITLGRGDVSIYIWRDRWSHTTARAYRGNALTAILIGQRAIVDYLRAAT